MPYLSGIIRMVIINSIISPSHAGEFEDDGENDSACDKESEVINCDVEQNMKYVERLFFHGRSPLCHFGSESP